MTPPSGREPARPQPGAARPTAAQPRLSREAVVAFVLLPVLLAAGFFLGSQLLGDGGAPPRVDAAAPQTPAAEGNQGVQGPVVPTGAATSPDPGVQGPTAPAEPAQPLPGPSAPPTQAASPEPTRPASPEPTQAPTQPPSPAPTQAPTQAPSPAPTQEPTQPPAQPGPQGPTTGAGPAPTPQAGDGVLLFKGFAGEDVRTWQARMAERGWAIQVDGIYGAQSASVARRFQAEKGLRVDGLVGIQTWNAAWQTPIT